MDQEDHSEEIRKLEAKLKRVGERYEDGDIDRDEYVTKRDAVKAQIVKLSAASPKTGKAPEPLPDNWREVYTSLSESDKKLFWRSFIKRIEIKKESEPVIFLVSICVLR